MLRSVDLPLPHGPSITTNSPGVIQRHAAKGMHVDFAHPVNLGDIPQGKDGV